MDQYTPTVDLNRQLDLKDNAFLFSAIASIEEEILTIKQSGCYSLMTPTCTVYAAALRRVADRMDPLDGQLGQAMLRLS